MEGRRRGECEIRFMGRITAGITHEMRNVLAVIRESAGLIQDLMEKCQDVPNRERLERALNTIQDQVEKGTRVASRLNSFAHSPDELWKDVDLVDVIDEICILLNRKAKHAGAWLVFQPHERVIQIRTDPFYLRMVICAAVEYLLGKIEPGRAVNLSITRGDTGGLKLLLHTGTGGQGIELRRDLPNEVDSLKDIVDYLRFKISWAKGAEGELFVVELGG